MNVDNIEVRIESTILDDIEQYRTDYIGDAPKVSSIAQLLSYPKDFRYSSIELKTQTKPYELIVYLTGNDPVQKKDFDLCAATAFDLIGNMDVITFCKVETGETIASFVRSDFDKVEVYDLDTAINQAILEHGCQFCHRLHLFASANAQCQRCGPVSVLIGYVSANGHKI